MKEVAAIFYFRIQFEIKKTIDSLLPTNQDVHGEYDMDDSEDLFELLANLDECTTAAINATKKSTEEKYIEETIEAVENVGRFSHISSKSYLKMANQLKLKINV